MFAKVKLWSILLVSTCVFVTPLSGASAVTAEVAKKCAALTAKGFPPRVIGNPAAGSQKGSGRAEQKYFNKCVAHGGRI
jgi:hypothetical protein